MVDVLYPLQLKVKNNAHRPFWRNVYTLQNIIITKNYLFQIDVRYTVYF